MAASLPEMAAAVRRLFRGVTEAGCALAAEGDLVILRAALQDRVLRAGVAPVARAVQMLRDDPARAVTLAELAAMVGLTRFHFLRSFARETGLTPHAYQVQARLHLARRMIARGMPLADAAAEAGFADQSHLTRVFGRSYGMTPGAYARNFVQDRAAVGRA